VTIETQYAKGDTVPCIIDGGVWQCEIRDIYVTFLYAMHDPVIVYSGDAYLDITDPKGKVTRQTRSWSGNEDLIDQARHANDPKPKPTDEPEQPEIPF
jgi:hypothetical protein